MSDLISRQDAIDMFQNLAYDDWNQGVSTTWANAYSESAEMIRDLPSAQPQQTCEYWDSESKFCALCRPSAHTVDAVKHGYWKVDKKGYPHIICSLCDVHIPMVAGWCMDAHINYCPNCGAKMDVTDINVGKMDGKEQDDG